MLEIIHVVAICVIIIVVLYIYVRSQRLEEMIGVYVTPDNLAQELGLNSMTMIVTDTSYFGTVYGYLVINNITVPFEMSVPVLSLSLEDVPVYMSFEVDDPEDFQMPPRMNLTLKHGHIMLEDDDNIYVAAQWIPVF